MRVAEIRRTVACLENVAARSCQERVCTAIMKGDKKFLRRIVSAPERLKVVKITIVFISSATTSIEWCVFGSQIRGRYALTHGRT